MQAPYPPPHGLDPTGASDLAELVAEPGPFVTAYLQCDPEAFPAPATSEAHWRALRRQLERDGAPPDALAAIDALVPDAHRFGTAMAAIATTAGLRLVEYHDEPLARDLGRVGALPSLGPVLEWRERRPRGVVALCDLAGADLFVFDGARERAHRVAGDLEPHDPMLHKARSGGWSEPRFHRRVEHHWDQDARAVAEQLEELVHEVHPRVVLAGGEARALERLRAALGRALRERVHEVPGSRHPGGGEEHSAEAIERAVHSAVAADHAAALAALRELTDKELACSGAAATLAALGQGAVQLLLVNDDPDDDRQAWWCRSPFACALEEAPLRELGVAPERARLVDVAIAAAFSSGADVRVVPAAPALRDALGALLRFSEADSAP